MWHLQSDRITLDLDGPSVEVERLRSWPIQYQAMALADAYNTAKTPHAEYAALGPLFEKFIYEAQPTWNISDQKGIVPTTANGMMRLPLSLSLSMVREWIESLPVPNADEPPSAVDAVIPPGPANKEIKRRLRSVKAA